MPPWFYFGICIHVLIAIIFVSGLMYYYFKSNTVSVKLATSIDKFLKPFGYDAAPFIPQWYNDLSTIVKLDLDPKTGTRMLVIFPTFLLHIPLITRHRFQRVWLCSLTPRCLKRPFLRLLSTRIHLKTVITWTFVPNIT